MSSHDLIQVNLVVQVVVILKTAERFEHFLYLAAKVLDQCFVLYAQALLRQTVGLLLHTRLLLIHDRLKDATLVILRLHFLRFQIYDLSELVHRVTAGEHFSQDFGCQLLQRVLQIFDRQIRRLQVLLELIRLVIE